ncbi:MAG: hypothetical protein HKL80_09355 [Acidimicrobiales bacterium]|nr:hypothetical protein [Acidimicrobiales bacterium]
MSTKNRSTDLMVVSFAVILGLLIGMILRFDSGNSPSKLTLRSSPAITVPKIIATTTTVAPATTTTVVDPGSLPQEKILPGDSDPLFLSHMQDVWQAIITGNTSDAFPAFFPMTAYEQIKALPNPAADYTDRLIPGYEQQLYSLHSELGSNASIAQYVSTVVPSQYAVWVLPGVEANSGSYYRVYGTRMYYKINGILHYFTLLSLISWRGEWYIVHVTSFT